MPLGQRRYLSFKSPRLHSPFSVWTALPLCSSCPPSLPSSPRFVHFCPLLIIRAWCVRRLDSVQMCTHAQVDLCHGRGQAIVVKERWGGGAHFKGILFIFRPFIHINVYEFSSLKADCLKQNQRKRNNTCLCTGYAMRSKCTAALSFKW